MRRLALAAAVAIVIAACSVDPSRDGLHVDNETTRAMTILVNGVVEATVAPRDSVTIPAADLPAGSWRVDARLPGGRSVVSVKVEPAGVIPLTEDGGAAVVSGSSMWADLSCGRIGVWVGVPAARPSAGPGTPGDCQG
jgi:hypothetical protein